MKLVIHHASCMDGVTSAALAGIKLAMSDTEGAGVFTLAAHYPRDKGTTTVRTYTADGKKEEVPLVDFIRANTNDLTEILIVDFSVSVSETYELWRMVRGALTVYDHHSRETEEADFKKVCLTFGDSRFVDWANSDSLTLHSSVSGAGLVLADSAHVFDNLPMHANIKRVATYVSDRDTWQRDNKDAIAFHEGISPHVFSKDEATDKIYPFNPFSGFSGAQTRVEYMGAVLNSPEHVQRALDEGRVIIEYRDSVIRSIVESEARFYGPNKIADCKHVIVSCPYVLSSECGDYLRENFPDYDLFLMVRNNFGRDYSCSVRSRMPEFSAKQFAQHYGGGGHDAAAGCSIRVDELRHFYAGAYTRFKTAAQVRAGYEEDARFAREAAEKASSLQDGILVEENSVSTCSKCGDCKC